MMRKMSGDKLHISISTGTLVRAILLVLLVGLLFVLKDVVLVVLTAIVLASAIEPAVRWFMKYRIPRVIGVLLVYFLVFGLGIGFFYFFLPPLVNDLAGLLSVVPQYLDSFRIPASDSGFPFGTTEEVRISLKEAIFDFQGTIANTSEGLIRTVNTIFGGLLSFVLVIVLSFYFAVQETGIDDFLRVITPAKHQEYVVNLWRRSQAKIGKWMQGQLLLSIIVGVLLYLGLTILGVPYALLLAIVAGVLELIPVFGSLLAAIPAVAVAISGGDVTLALLTAGLYLIVNQFQANLIYPLVVRKIVGVPPLLVILALIVGAKVAGFLGIILSVPAAAAIQEFVADIQKEKAGKVSTDNTEKK
ncbi:MAG: AI-2E family transporter [Candidatus Paceibacterota bacterium]